MKTHLQSIIEQASPNPIRVETALSRYPIHRLAKNGDVAIDIHEQGTSGEVSIKWEVSHNSKYGQPGPLAYKLDTLVINRRIEEASRPIPPVIRLGSHRDICKDLGLSEGGRTFEQHKKALHQNASSYITARITYKAKDGSERTVEIGDTRYAVIFTGESLPDGRIADAIYIVLHDFYKKILDNAMTRPLDYDYLKSLPPASQRFYELLSYQIYAAIKNDRPRAKLVYSELCRYAPLMRQATWNQVRPQLARIHAPHKESGYIAKIDFNEITDSDGHLDWELCYQPGPKARAEFRAFTKRGGPVRLEVEPFPADFLPQLDAPEPTPPLVAELIQHRVTEAIARQLAAEHDEAKICTQIEILGWYMEKKPGKIDDPAAWLVSAIKTETGHAPPKGFVSRADREKQKEERQAKDDTAAEARRQQHQQEAARKQALKAVDDHLKGLSPVERLSLEAEALATASPESRNAYESPALKKYRDTVMLTMLREHLQPILRQESTTTDA